VRMLASSPDKRSTSMAVHTITDLQSSLKAMSGLPSPRGAALRPAVSRGDAQ
jgi:hypothetical protein